MLRPHSESGIAARASSGRTDEAVPLFPQAGVSRAGVSISAVTISACDTLIRLDVDMLVPVQRLGPDGELALMASA